MALVDRWSRPSGLVSERIVRLIDLRKVGLIVGPATLLVVGWLLINPENGTVETLQSFPSGVPSPDEIRVIDGDTIEYQGLSYRLAGYDTPETRFADCPAEKAKGEKATHRLQELINRASKIELRTEGGRDRYGRGLGRLLLDNQDVGTILISEGLARAYDGGKRAGWC